MIKNSCIHILYVSKSVLLTLRSRKKTEIQWIQRSSKITETWIGGQFKDPDMCLAGTAVASWSLTQEMTGSNPLTVMRNILVTEVSEFSENI